MTRMIAAVFAAVAACFVASSAAARSPLLPEPITPGFCFETFSFQYYDVYYINGVRTKQWQAEDALEQQIEPLFIELYSDYSAVCEDPFAFKLQYNKTTNALSDIIETFQQRANSSFVGAWRRVVAVVNGVSAALADQPAINEDDAQDVAQLLLLSGTDSEEIALFATQYEATLSSGPGRRNFFSRCPMVVAYSQGNLFANRAAALVNDPYCLSVVSIATPDSLVRGFAGDWATLVTDLVIQAVRNVPFTDVLLSNVDDPGLNLVGNHGLAENYLKAGSNARRRIGDAIDKFTFCGQTFLNPDLPDCPQ